MTPIKPLRNTGVASSSVSVISWGEGASLASVGHWSSDAVTIKMPDGVRFFFYIDQPYTLSFLIGVVISKSESLDQLELTEKDECLW